MEFNRPKPQTTSDRSEFNKPLILLQGEFKVIGSMGKVKCIELSYYIELDHLLSLAGSWGRGKQARGGGLAQ